MATKRSTPGTTSLKRDREVQRPASRVKGGQTPDNQRTTGHQIKPDGGPVARSKESGTLRVNTQAAVDRTPLPEVYSCNSDGDPHTPGGSSRIGAKEIEAPPEF